MSSEQPIKVLVGIGKRLEVYPDRVEIKRSDVLASVMPTGFGDSDIAFFDQISRVDLQEPEVLRLDECEGNCVKLIITRADHTTLSITVTPKERQTAYAVRAHIQAHLSKEISQP